MIGVNIHIDASEVEEWAKRGQMEIEQAQRDLLSGVGRDMEHKLQDEATDITVTSGLHNSIQSRMDTPYRVRVDAINYAEIAMETGRKPGVQPPVSQLKRWARLKLGNEKLAYAVARSIGKRGTRLYREKRPKRIMRAFQDVIRQDVPKRILYFMNAITK